MKTLKDKIFALLVLLMAVWLAYGSYTSFQEAKVSEDDFESFEYEAEE